MNTEKYQDRIYQLESELKYIKKKAISCNGYYDGYKDVYYGDYSKKDVDVERLYKDMDVLEAELKVARAEIAVALQEAKETEEKLRKQIEKKDAALQLQRSELILELQPLLEMSDDTSANAVRDFIHKLIAKMNGAAPEQAALEPLTIEQPLVAKTRKIM